MEEIPIANAIAGFVRNTFGVQQVPPPSAYDLEQQMGPSALMARWDSLIAQASQRFGVPAPWIKEVMRMESGGRTMSGENAPIVSRAGAMGLMQLMPDTYADMRAEYGLGANPFDPRDNIFAGVAYLKWLHGKYGYPAMFAAYNDGPGNLEARMADSEQLPAEARNYLTRITARLGDASLVLRSGSAPRLLRLTRPNGEPVLIDAARVVALHPALPGDFAQTVKTVIIVGRTYQGVRESMAEVSAMLHFRESTAAAEKSRRIRTVFLFRPECRGQPHCAHSSS